MALIVEDGTGLSTAETYISVADTLAYLTAMGTESAWVAATTAQKEGALRRAAQYLEGQYQWLAYPLNSAQALAWPRTAIEIGYRLYSWPVKAIREACAELALRALSQDLFADEGQTIKSEQVGPIRTEYESGISGSQQRFVAVDRMVAPFTRSSGAGRSSMRVERVQ